jgi:hypothetical protein
MCEQEFLPHEADLADAFEIWEARIESARSVNSSVPNDCLAQRGLPLNLLFAAVISIFTPINMIVNNRASRSSSVPMRS